MSPATQPTTNACHCRQDDYDHLCPLCAVESIDVGYNDDAAAAADPSAPLVAAFRLVGI